MNQFTGKQLYYAFAAGGQAVISLREDLNRLNVYPVPDGDTGSNLSFTVKNIIEQTQISANSAGDTMQSLAEAALSGARGNSGILFAQFVNGMAEKIGNVTSLTMELFVDSVAHAVQSAYSAMSNPVEGTMLTVMKDFSASLQDKLDQSKDFSTLFKSSMKQVKKSLNATKDTLEVLRKANVIDAGAKGFAAFLEGFQQFIQDGGQVDHLDDDRRPEVIFEAHAEHHDEVEVEDDLTFRYCTEGYIAGENLQLETIRKDLVHYGDSLIVAGSNKIARIHIHSDHPDKVFQVLRSHGEIREQKADDMHRQFQMVHNRKSEIALVIDSTCDLPESFMDEHQIYQVPLNVHFGKDQYLDGLTLKPGKFYSLMESSKDFPQTSQPSVKTYTKLFDHLTSHYTSVICLSISSGLSGTYNGVLQAASKFHGAKITPVDSLEAAAGLGLLAMNAALDIEQGLSHEQVVERIHENRKRTHTLVVARNLKNFVRGGRVSPVKGLIGKLLNVKPIISVSTDGKAFFLDKAFGHDKADQCIINRVIDLHREKGIQNLAIVHGNDLERVQRLAAAITDKTGVVPDFIDEITPVLGAHSGPGAFDVALITKR